MRPVSPAKTVVFAMLALCAWACGGAGAAPVTVPGGTFRANWIHGSTEIALPAVGPGESVAGSFVNADIAVEWTFRVSDDADEFWGTIRASSAALAFAALSWDVVVTERFDFFTQIYSVDQYDVVGFDDRLWSLRGSSYGWIDAGAHTWGMGYAQELSLHQGDVHAWVVPEPATGAMIAWALGAGAIARPKRKLIHTAPKGLDRPESIDQDLA